MSLYNFYRSDAWEKLIAVLKNERVDESGQILCDYCHKPITLKYDCIAHHIVELTEDNYTNANVSLNPDNIILVHHRCHNKIHDKYGMMKERQVFIVYGAPLSGKTSYVSEVANCGDLIIDIDNIWQCVSGQERYVKPNRLKAVVFSVRDNLLESVKYRRGKWLNAYIIGGYPYEPERLRLADSLGARLIHIDTPMEECLSRLEKCTDRNYEEWSKYITDYFLQYSGGY